MAQTHDVQDPHEAMRGPRLTKFKPGSTMSLKRSYGSSNSSTLPPAPKLDNEVFLEVYSHPSLSLPSGFRNEDFGDSARLAELGSHVLPMIVTWCLFSKQPLLTSEQISLNRREILSDANIDVWLTGYKMRENLRFAPDLAGKISSPEESKKLFYTFVGGVYYQSGLQTTMEWISRLTDPDSHPPSLPRDQMEAKRPRLGDAHTSPPPPPVSAPPPLPSTPSSPAISNVGPPATNQPYISGNTYTSASPSTAPISGPSVGPAYLPLFNQIASQRRIPVDYTTVFTGPPHTGRWTVSCIVNGVEKGKGTATSKQLAKEEAAKLAYFAMGWHGGPAQSSAPTPTASTPFNALKSEDVDMGIPPAYQQSAQPTPPADAPPAPAGPPPDAPPRTFPAYGSSLFGSSSFGSSTFGSAASSSSTSVSGQSPLGVAFLPLFNQVATQRRIPVEYPAEFSGPPHAGRWTVRCVVNGIVKGQGAGASKQLAKEQAAKQAYHAMGWANRI